MTDLDKLKTAIDKSPKNKAGKRIFSDDVRKHVVAAIRNSELSKNQVCKFIGLSPALVCGWQNKYAAFDLSLDDFIEIPVRQEPEEQQLLAGDAQLCLSWGKDIKVTGNIDSIFLLIRRLHDATVA